MGVCFTKNHNYLLKKKQPGCQYLLQKVHQFPRHASEVFARTRDSYKQKFCKDCHRKIGVNHLQAY